MDTHVQSLPYQPTPFIGRESEIEELTRLLHNDRCRLLTLVGPGGIGKTRLGIEVAAQVATNFADGVHFVPLASLASAKDLVSTIAHALGFQFHGTTSPHQQLLNYLGTRHLLLVLDNFEHLLNGVDLIADILNAAPAVKVLLTSREVLNLQEEWVRSIGGMPYPEDGVVDDAKAYGAVQLYADRARRVRGDFSLDDEFVPVIRICQLVEGMPLALELAAWWRNALSCEAIANRIEAGIDFLATKLRNVEARHRSIQAVFDQSWTLLTDEEKQVFARLSVFHGGFTADAADSVAGASLSVLASLVDKSFVRVNEAGRFDLHELLRQYAAGQLAADPTAEQHAFDSHCAYYALFIDQRTAEIAYGDAQDVIVEIDNLRAVWDWAVEHHRLTQIADMTEGLSFLYPDRMGLLEESRMQFERAAQALATDNPDGEQGIVYGQVLAALGIAEYDLAHFERAREVMRKGIGILRHLDAPKSVLASSLCFASVAASDLTEKTKRVAARDIAEKTQLMAEFIALSWDLGDQWRVAHGFYQLGYIYYEHAQFALARSCGQELLAIAHNIENSILMAQAHLLLGELDLHFGDYLTARQHVEAAVPLYGSSYPLRRIRCVWLLGILDYAQGRYADAERHYRANLELLEKIGLNEYPVAQNLSALALVAAARGNHSEAQRLAEQCLAFYRDRETALGLGVTGTLVMMGYLAVESGDTEEAMRCYEAVWRKGQEIGLMAITLEVVMGVANLAAKTGDKRRSVELLALGSAHDWDTQGGLERKPLYHRLRDTLKAEMNSATFEAAWARGQKLDLEATVRQLLTQYSPKVNSTADAANQVLVDSLTARELEVLELLAQGHSNRQIAETLVIAVGTVKRYVYTICQKLDANNRTQAVVNAQRLDLL